MKEKLREIWENKLKIFCKKDNMILLVLAGILILIISLPSGNRRSGSQEGSGGKESLSEGGGSLLQEMEGSDGQDNSRAKEEFSAEEYRRELQAELESMLGAIDGVGEVRVMITLKESEELIVEKDYRKNQKQTKEIGISEKGASEVSLEETTVEDKDRNPLVVKKVYPKIEGVIVAAEGAGQGRVRADLTEAVTALLGLEAHRVNVLKLSHKSPRQE